MDGRGVSVEGMLWIESGCMVPIFCCVFIGPRAQVGRCDCGVGRGVWPCWARWLGWAWCWAPGLAVLGALAGLGVGFGRAGRAGWVGRGFKVQKYTLEIQK